MVTKHCKRGTLEGEPQSFRTETLDKDDTPMKRPCTQHFLNKLRSFTGVCRDPVSHARVKHGYVCFKVKQKQKESSQFIKIIIKKNYSAAPTKECSQLLNTKISVNLCFLRGE